MAWAAAMQIVYGKHNLSMESLVMFLGSGPVHEFWQGLGDCLALRMLVNQKVKSQLQ